MRPTFPTSPGRSDDTWRRYVAQCIEMTNKAKQWAAAHPTTVVVINFDFPEKAVIMGVISDALKLGLIKTNDAGRELIEACCNPNEQTVLMLQAVLKVAFPWKPNPNN